MPVDKRPITVDDLNKIIYVEDPNISPDGQWIAYVQVTPDAQENSYTRNIWLVPTNGDDPMQLTRSNKDGEPRWSPDGKTLAFTSGRNNKPQIFLLPIASPGGEARALTSIKNGATSPAWSPDGTSIAFLSALNADERAKEDSGEEDEPPVDKLAGKHREEREAEDERQRWDPHPMWRVPYRVGTSFLDERYQQVYVITTDADAEGEETKPRRLTDINADHMPPQWSPDGKRLYTSRQVDIEADEPFRHMNIYQITVADGTSERIVDEDFSVYAPLPSPDGNWLACGRTVRGKTDKLQRLTLIATKDGTAQDLNLEMDRTVDDWDWSPDGKLVFAAANGGRTQPYEYDPATGELEMLTDGNFVIRGLAAGANGSLAFTISTPENPNEVYWREPGGQRAKQVTRVNQKLLNEVIVQPFEEVHYQSPDGNEVHGWYLLPTDYEEGKQYPLALNIHGGPHVMWSPSERSMWHEWQLHAASGYAVFACNPRGSDGYGEDFQSGIHSDWGDVAMRDIMAGVDLMIDNGFVDAERMAVTGGSYGGYMTAWIVGHTDRFQSAVTQRGVYNLISFYGTSDVPILISNEFDAEPWENQEHLWKHSPLAYAHKMKTPLLIIHSENDYRVPIEQAEQLFAFVRRSGGTTKMLRYPREGHELSRSGEPKHRISRLTEIMNWFDRYCKPD